MRKLAFLLLIASGLAFAQTPTVEVFGGYSLAHSPGQTFHGWNGAANFNVYRCLGITADFAGGYWSHFRPAALSAFGDITERTHTFSYTFGPSLTLRNRSRFAPFGHFLLGGTRFSAHNTVGTVDAKFANNYLTVITGGGLDIKIGHNFALRPVQLEYRAVHFSGPQPGWSNGVRYSAGVVFRFGEKK